MTVPATPWMRRLPHAPVAAPPPQQAHLDLTHPPRGHTPTQTPSPSPGPSPTPPPAPAPAPLTVLDAPSHEAAPVAPAPTRGAALLLIPPPPVDGLVTLDPDDPVARMDALQSAIGGLVIRGADRVAWEDIAERTGVVGPRDGSTGDEVPRFGNRSLIRPYEGTVLLALRHVRALRRLLIDVPANTAVTFDPYCAGSVRAADATRRLRVSVVVVDGRLETRVEYGLPDDWAAALTAMGWSPLASIPRTTPDDWQ